MSSEYEISMPVLRKLDCSRLRERELGSRLDGGSSAAPGIDRGSRLGLSKLACSML